MEFLTDSLLTAFFLVIHLDSELLTIVGTSLKLGSLSTIIASLVGVPSGFIIGLTGFRGKAVIITILNTLLALPTVVVGLFVYAFFSRRGIFGPLDMLYTQKAVIIGQSILIIPVVTVFTISAIERLDRRYAKTAMTLGAGRFQTALVIFREARFGVFAAIIASFGRVLAEVGVSMMLGGNIKGFTRTITTAMALEYDKGELGLAFALGMVLMILAFGMNLLFHYLRGTLKT